ncbi:MAG: hypothetical protein ACW967_02270 [Candidatus Hodarchaeales archaeon]|jgi:hypothetical protein
MSSLLKPNPEPVLISDSQTKSLSIFGGIQVNFRNRNQSPFNFSTKELVESISEFTEELSPLIDDAYRADLSSYDMDGRIVTSFSPLRRKLRTHPASTADWKVNEFMKDFRTLQGIVLQNYIEGRHTTFGLKPEKSQLLFCHMLNRDARKIHEFIGQLHLKILNFFASKGKIHYFNEQDKVLITTFVQNIEKKEKDDSYIYF